MDNQLQLMIAGNFKNTELGIFRIKRNLDLLDFTNPELEKFLKNALLSTPLDSIETKGKNHYFVNKNCNVILTVNSGSFTIITAKKISLKSPVAKNNA